MSGAIEGKPWPGVIIDESAEMEKIIKNKVHIDSIMNTPPEYISSKCSAKVEGVATVMAKFMAYIKWNELRLKAQALQGGGV